GIDAARFRETLEPSRNAIPSAAGRPQHPRRAIDAIRCDVATAHAASDVAKRNSQAVARLDAFAVALHDVEKKTRVIAAFHTLHPPPMQCFRKWWIIAIDSRDDFQKIGRQQRPLRSGNRERLLRNCVLLAVRMHANRATRPAFRDCDSEWKRTASNSLRARS